jgi:hypothetical protein
MIVVCWKLDSLCRSVIGQQEVTYCVDCKLCDNIIVVCWQLDSLCRSVIGSAGSDLLCTM